MSLLQTIGARQSTFTIDSTDATSRTSSGLSIGKDKSANCTISCDTDLLQDNHVSTKNAEDEAAKKRRLTSLNSRLNGSNKPQSGTNKQQGPPDTNIHCGAKSNTDILENLSSSVRNRLKHNHRRKFDIRVLNRAEENTKELVNGIVKHTERHSNGQVIPRTVANDTASSPSTASVDTSKIRKSASFSSHSETFVHRSPVQFGENRIANKTILIKLPKDESNLAIDSFPTPLSQTAFLNSIQSKPAGESQITEHQFHHSSTHLHSVQHQSPSPPHTHPEYSGAQIADISNALTSQNYDRNTCAKRITETHVNGNYSVISDTDFSNNYLRKQNRQRKRAGVNKSLEAVTREAASKKAETNKVIHNISELNAGSGGSNLRSSETINSDGSNKKTSIPVLESAAASTDVQASRWFISRDIGEIKQKVDRRLPDDSVPTEQSTSFFPSDNQYDRDRMVLENNKYCVNNGKKHDKQRKHNLHLKSIAEPAENTPTPVIQQTEVLQFKMARSGKFDYASETFEDVLTERNDMAKTERVYRMRIRQLEEELKQMVYQCQGLSNENKELRKTLDGIKTSKERSDNVDLLKKLTDLESEKAKLAEEYNKTLKQMDSVMLDNAKIRSVNAELDNKVKEGEKHVASLHAQVQSNESEKTRGLEAKIRDLQATLKDLENEKKAMEARVKSLEYDNTSLKDSVESKRREIDDLTSSLHTISVTEENLKVSQDENHHLKRDLTEMKEKLRDLEVSKEKLQELLNERDNTLKKVKTENDGKDKVIAQLQKDSELSMQEIKKLNDSQQATRDKEKESLVSRIASLKAEIDSSLSENHKLKQERKEMSNINDKLRQEILEAIESSKESKKNLRKWEQEKEYRAKVENDLDKKKEEALLLETRLKEAEQTVSMLKNKVKSLEDEHDDVHNSTTNNSETRVIKDRNMKLRQMLVERNIELTNTKHEQALTDSRIQHLERKQKHAEVRVKQLSEYIGSVIYSSGQESGSEATKVIPMSPEKKSPPSQPHKVNSKQSPRKAIELPTKESNRIGGTEVEQTTSSLPMLETPSAPGPRPRNGYFSLYREKQKLVKNKGYM
ncbi:hypothetical protein BsWGS_06863 [Bradybaena similaris]